MVPRRREAARHLDIQQHVCGSGAGIGYDCERCSFRDLYRIDMGSRIGFDKQYRRIGKRAICKRGFDRMRSLFVNEAAARGGGKNSLRRRALFRRRPRAVHQRVGTVLRKERVPQAGDSPAHRYFRRHLAGLQHLWITYDKDDKKPFDRGIGSIQVLTDVKHRWPCRSIGKAKSLRRGFQSVGSGNACFTFGQKPQAPS